MEPVLLLRHCPSASPEPNAPLSASGLLAARFLAERLSDLGVDTVYAGPTVQAMETLAPYADMKGLALTMDERFGEERLICWPFQEAALHMRKYFRDPYNYAPGAGAETLYEAQTRGLAALADIAGRGHELPAVATHGILLSAILKHFKPDFGFADWQALKMPELYKITFDGARPVKIEPVATETEAA